MARDEIRKERGEIVGWVRWVARLDTLPPPSLRMPARHTLCFIFLYSQLSSVVLNDCIMCVITFTTLYPTPPPSPPISLFVVFVRGGGGLRRRRLRPKVGNHPYLEPQPSFQLICLNFSFLFLCLFSPLPLTPYSFNYLFRPVLQSTYPNR